MLPDGEHLDAYRRSLGAHRLLLIVLDPGGEVCRQRNQIRAREEQFFFDNYNELRASMHDGFSDKGWWLDTSALTPEDTVEYILRDAARRAPVAKRNDQR